MTTLAQRKPRVKPVRTLAVVKAACPTNDIVEVRVTEGTKVDHYLVKPIPSDWGMAFLVEKQDAERTQYHLLLERDGHTCTCPGHTYRGRCRHAALVPVLLERGALQSSWPQGYAAWSESVSEGRE